MKVILLVEEIHLFVFFLLSWLLFRWYLSPPKNSKVALLQQPKVQVKHQKSILPFFTSCSTISITPSINNLESSSDFIILIISSISSFEVEKVNPFPTLKAPFSLILLSNLCIAFKTAFEAVLLTNRGNLFLANGTA